MKESPYIEKRQVYDPLLRLIHAWNLVAVFGLVATGSLAEAFEHSAAEKSLWHIHIYLGYALVLGLAARLAWGIVGPRHARFSDMWHPAAWLALLKLRSAGAAPRFGHDPLASAAYLGAYGLLLGMAASGLGLAAIEHGMGPLAAWLDDSVWFEEFLEEPHEVGFALVLAFITAHLAAVAWHEWRDRTPFAQSMWTGYQYRCSQGKNHE